jgi:tetratricopeptide (TPR) repeat protein
MTKLYQIPTPLIEAMKGRRAVLFLGAGASLEATDDQGRRTPDGDGLRDLISEKFFGKTMAKRSLASVSEMAIATSGGRSLVYDYVRQVLEPYAPNDAHRLVSEFPWRLLVTTNYDLLIERAYGDNKTSALQDLVRFVKDAEPVEEMMQKVSDPLQYIKLHGCLEHIHDGDIPLVLSHEQYASYSNNRSRLFDRVRYFAPESTIIFVGYKIEDPHIRDLIYRLQPSARPRWYIVAPDAEKEDVDFWGAKNVEVIPLKFGDFMQSLDAAVPPLWRKIQFGADTASLPIRKFYVTSTSESEGLARSLERDLTLVQGDMPYEKQGAKEFYEGFDGGWGGIFAHYDVRRKVEDDLLFKAVLEYEDPDGPKLLLLRGAAGAGKTIALKRTAIEAANSGALVLWLNEAGGLRSEDFVELWELTKRPIYLFVDQIALHVDKVLPLLTYAKSKNLPIVVVASERDADWNTYCGRLDADFPPVPYRIGNLSEPEINNLLDNLERHNCLGALKGVPRGEQVEAFLSKERADRQLLVALHELTQGKPFEEIVAFEHQRVNPESARQLYLDIATMHQFGVSARAGSIARISGIEFEKFEAELFQPLENIVRIVRDKYTGDFAYQTRHARVAQIVFRMSCPDDASKAKQLDRILSGLDIGFSSDSRVLQEITKGRALAGAFATVEPARELYKTAIKSSPTQAFLYQQWAIFEINHSSGSVEDADTHITKARELDPRNNSIIHTQAEIDRRRANEEGSPLLKESLRKRARTRLGEMRTNDRFALSTRCKLLVDEVSDLRADLRDGDASYKLTAFAEKVRDAEDAIHAAEQAFPEEADLLQIEARLRGLLQEDERALRALEKAWAIGPRGTGTAIRIANIYGDAGRGDEAVRLLREALGRVPDDKAAHGALSNHLLNFEPLDLDLVIDHAKRSFSVEDQNYESRFWLAQCLFLKGDKASALELFSQIDGKAPPSFRPKPPSRDNEITKKIGRSSGSVVSLRDRFFFVRTGAYPRDLFSHVNDLLPEVEEDLREGAFVTFQVRFNRQGPVAVDVRLGR